MTFIFPIFSPCKDAGTKFSCTPHYQIFEGDLRISNNNIDIGADEYYRHLYMTGNFFSSGAVKFKLIGEPLVQASRFLVLALISWIIPFILNSDIGI